MKEGRKGGKEMGREEGKEERRQGGMKTTKEEEGR